MFNDKERAHAFWKIKIKLIYSGHENAPNKLQVSKEK